MTYIEAIILGLVQGITEFIPISSSGHLVIASNFLSVDSAFTFDSLLNIGTLAALIYYYKNRLIEILRKLFSKKEWIFILKILVATIPALIIGAAFHSQIEKLNEMVWVVIVMLILLGVPMILIGKAVPDSDDRPLEKSANWRRAIIIGISQAIALIPGSSRSGITILTGLRTKLSASKAAEFSFLLAIPVIAGAILKLLFSSDGITIVTNNTGQFIVGNIAAFVSGMLAISFFINWLSQKGLQAFGWYRLGLAGVLIILVITGVI